MLALAVIAAVPVLFITVRDALAAPTISDTAAMHDLRAAGFTGLTLNYYAQVDNTEPEIDTIDPSRFAHAPTPPVELIHYTSATIAKKGYVPGPRFVRLMVAGDVPRRFSLRKALSFRICNVILWSYNVTNDPILAGRVRRAARLLRQSCH